MQNQNNTIDLDPKNDLKLPPELKITSGIPSIQSLQTFTPPSDIPQRHIIDDGLPALPDERLAIEVTTPDKPRYINENNPTDVKKTPSNDNISMLINIGIGIVIVLVLVEVFLVLVYFNIVSLPF